MLSASIIAKLDELAQRHEELALLLAAPEAAQDRARYANLMKEFADLAPITDAYGGFKRREAELESARALLDDADPELRALAREPMPTPCRPNSSAPSANWPAVWCRQTPTTPATPSLRSAPAPAATKRRSSPAICSECTPVTRIAAGGNWSASPSARASAAATRK